MDEALISTGKRQVIDAARRADKYVSYSQNLKGMVDWHSPIGRSL